MDFETSFETTNRLSNANMRPEKISKITHTLDQNKVLGHDEISVRIIKMWGSSVIKPAQVLLIIAWSEKFSLTFWRWLTLFPCTKKNSKQLVDN